MSYESGAAEKKQSRREDADRSSSPLLFLSCIGALLGFLLFYPLSGNWERLLEPKNLSAAAELSFVTALLFLLEGSLLHGRLTRRWYGALVSLLFSAELYLHRMLLPFLLSGLYFALLALLFLWIFGELGAVRDMLRRFRDGTGRSAARGGAAAKRQGVRYGQEMEREAHGVYRLSYALPFLLIQLNRMNIAADYDSLRYGLRSRYVLLNGSFFSALGQVNAVYSYPKGLELLLAPISSFPCFALPFMLQFWTLLAIALLLWLLSRQLSGSRLHADLAVQILLMLSAVTNMSLTAKTDLLTLLFQLLLLFYFLREKPWKGLAAGIFSYSLKPTAVVFTTLSLLVLSGELLRERCLARGREAGGRRDGLFCADSEARGAAGGAETGVVQSAPRSAAAAGFRSALPALLFCTAFTGLVTLRTLCITGVPVSTTFTALFQRMGFRVNWPFNLDAHIDYSGARSPGIALLSLLRRLFLLLFCPVGEDMLHVAIAWGGVWIPPLLALLFTERRRECAAGIRLSGERRLLYAQLFTVGAFSLLSLGMLWQVDGNYYILFDCLLLLAALSGRILPPRPVFRLLFLPALATTLITSWAGAVGFTPIDLVNRGYYDNIAVIREEEQAKGSLRFWEKLSENPKTRVLSFSETPDAYRLLCNVQAITDVEGSGGSPGLYDELRYFEWFLYWAETDYVYLERRFLEKPESERNRQLLPALLSDGMLREMDCEGGYMLLLVDRERLRYVWEGLPKPELSREETERQLRRYQSWLLEGAE